ncbi:hypothetical protein BGX33_001176 [Mortierella sp. NVP41]|nr:hypothetical protein BGX33_001176 [Mortierella sp. NVP41]
MATTPKHKPKLSYKAQSFPSSDKPFECTACQLYFRRLHDLKRHERLHTGERPYCCNNNLCAFGCAEETSECRV